jgi:hypothetical protein
VDFWQRWVLVAAPQRVAQQQAAFSQLVDLGPNWLAGWSVVLAPA